MDRTTLHHVIQMIVHVILSSPWPGNSWNKQKLTREWVHNPAIN